MSISFSELVEHNKALKEIQKLEEAGFIIDELPETAFKFNYKKEQGQSAEDILEELNNE